MKLLYPAIFYPCEAKEDCTVVLPDLPGCISEAKDIHPAAGYIVNLLVLDDATSAKMQA